MEAHGISLGGIDSGAIGRDDLVNDSIPAGTLMVCNLLEGILFIGTHTHTHGIGTYISLVREEEEEALSPCTSHLPTYHKGVEIELPLALTLASGEDQVHISLSQTFINQMAILEGASINRMTYTDERCMI